MRISVASARCHSCRDTGAVCENHPNHVWEGMQASGEPACCGGAGMPCPSCCAPIPQDGTASIGDAFTPPHDDFSGDLVLTAHYSPDGWDVEQVDIMTADPRIRVVGELLRHTSPAPWWSYDGSLLKVHGLNRTVVYRRAGYDAPRDQYLMEWPD